MQLTFTALEYSETSFRERFHALWPALEAWYLRDGDAARPTYVAARDALRAHMPELVPWWERLTELAGGGDLAARVLSLYDPPPLLAGCSQGVFGGALVRNYDYHPDRIEGTVLKTTSTLGMSDVLWGLLDGINADGFAVALAFGGGRSRGPGFGITLVVRYLLETCATVEQATSVLARLPVHAPYNLTIADPQAAVTVYVGPERAARVVTPAIATNHQEHVEPDAIRSAERYQALLGTPDFLAPPLYADEYERGFGTLYTAAYRMSDRAVTYRWPDAHWSLSLAAFTPGTRTVRLRARAVGTGPR